MFKPTYIILALLASSAAIARPLDAIKAEGGIRCGVSSLTEGVSFKDGDGKWSGFFIDMCKAVGVAIFDDDSRVNFVEIKEGELAKALHDGTVDVVSAPLPVNFSNSVGGIFFSAPFYFDRVALLAAPDSTFESLAETKDAILCSYIGFTQAEALNEHIAPLGIEAKENKTFSLALDNFKKKRCDILAGHGIALDAAAAQTPAKFLDDEIALQSFALATVFGNRELSMLTGWTFYATVKAYELGITAATIDDFSADQKTEVKELLANQSGQTLGVGRDWLYRVIKKTGNYKEIYDRNLGEASDFKLPLDQNDLWKNQGGLIFAPPLI